MNEIEIKILRPELVNLINTRYGTGGAAGMDLSACIVRPLELAPASTVFIPTGLAIHMQNQGWAAMILSRSGLGTKQGLVVKQGVGLIDSDYQGEIIVALFNLSDVVRTINPGDRIAQLVFTPVGRPAMKAVEAFSDLSARGSGGFGSTGLNQLGLNSTVW